MIRLDMSSGERPANWNATPITGMPMLGKMSTGILLAAIGPKIRSSNAITTKVSGRSKATFTIQVIVSRALSVAVDQISAVAVFFKPVRSAMKIRSLPIGENGLGGKSLLPRRQNYQSPIKHLQWLDYQYPIKLFATA
jgi:hypothetical protein